MVILTVDNCNVTEDVHKSLAQFFKGLLLAEVAQTVRRKAKKDMGVSFFADPASRDLKYIGTFALAFTGLKTGVSILQEIGVSEEDTKSKLRKAQSNLKSITEKYSAGEILSPQDEFVSASSIAIIEDFIREINERIIGDPKAINSTNELFQEFSKGLLDSGIQTDDKFHSYLSDLLTKKGFSIIVDEEHSNLNRVLKEVFSDYSFPPMGNKQTVYGVNINAVRWLRTYIFNNKNAIVERLKFQLNDADFEGTEEKKLKVKRVNQRIARRERAMEVFNSKPFEALVGKSDVDKKAFKLAKNNSDIQTTKDLEYLKNWLIEMRKRMSNKHRMQFGEGLKTTFIPQVTYLDGKLTVTLLENT